jgi:hypothetical protein
MLCFITYHVDESLEQDPVLIARMLVVGSDCLQQLQHKVHMQHVSHMPVSIRVGKPQLDAAEAAARDHIDKSRNR